MIQIRLCSDSEAKKASKIVATFGLIILLLISGASIFPVSAVTTRNVGPGQTYATIQAGVDAADPGDTVLVHPGTCDEQVVITESITLQGFGDSTIIKPSSATVLDQIFDGLYWYLVEPTKQIAGIVVANVPDGSSVTMMDFKVDASLITTKPAGADLLACIFYRETGGYIEVNVAGTGEWMSGNRAYGIYLSAATNVVSVEINDCTIQNFDKNGIELNGDTLTFNIHDNAITGRGPTLSGDECQNGINIGRNATGTVADNLIGNLEYGPQTWWACGIIIGEADGTITGNIISDCQMGIAFSNANVTVTDNTLNLGAVGLFGITGGYYTGSLGYTETGTWTMDIVGNTVTAANDQGGWENAAIGVQCYESADTLIATIEDNTLTYNSPPEPGMASTTTADGIIMGDTVANGAAGEINFVIKSNEISGWYDGIKLLSGVYSAQIVCNTIIDNGAGLDSDSGVHISDETNVGSVHINFNSIIGNEAFGVYNAGTELVDATCNWWGDSDGPTPPPVSNIATTGDQVSDDVEYSPWLTAAPPPTLSATDNVGTTKTQFYVGNTIYIKGAGYCQDMDYQLYVVSDTTWVDGMSIPSRVAGSETTASSDENGDIPVGTEAWSYPTLGTYDILIDVRGNGVYDACCDALVEGIQVTGGDFTLSVSPTAQTVAAGGATKHKVTVTLLSDDPGTVSLSLDLPANVGYYSFTPSSGTPTFTSTLIITTYSNAPAGVYNLLVTGSASMGPTKTTPLTLTVTVPTTLTLNLIPDTVARGAPLTISGQLTPGQATGIRIYYRYPHQTGPWAQATTLYTNPSGAYGATVTVPTYLTPGSYDLVAVWFNQNTGTYIASAIDMLTIT